MRPGTGGWHQRGSARSLRDIDIMKATGQSWNQERCRARAGINMSVHTHVAAVLANSWIWIPFPRPTTTVTLVAMVLPEITLRRSSRTTRRSQSHSKTPTAHQWVPWQSAASASVPVSLRRTRGCNTRRKGLSRSQSHRRHCWS